MAAAITDARGRILLARRTAGRDLAGLWEFPGGKREPGETPEHALVRELREELGIEVKIGAPLIAVAQQYPHTRLCLDVRRVTRWRGTPRGHEGQALAWVPPDKLPGYALDRQSAVHGTRVSVRVDIGGRRSDKNKHSCETR